jgi:hypothetical protein
MPLPKGLLFLINLAFSQYKASAFLRLHKSHVERDSERFIKAFYMYILMRELALKTVPRLSPRGLAF